MAYGELANSPRAAFTRHKRTAAAAYSQSATGGMEGEGGGGGGTFSLVVDFDLETTVLPILSSYSSC